jgi:hypothetical protein
MRVHATWLPNHLRCDDNSHVLLRPSLLVMHSADVMTARRQPMH